MIDKVARVFNSYYTVAINKRFIFGFNSSPLKHDQIDYLNLIIKKLDNPMLYGYEFFTNMGENVFDKLMCRVLYVAGKWLELSYYIMLLSLTDDSIVKFCYDADGYYFSQKGKATIIQIDDQKICAEIMTIARIEKEF